MPASRAIHFASIIVLSQVGAIVACHSDAKRCSAVRLQGLLGFAKASVLITRQSWHRSEGTNSVFLNDDMLVVSVIDLTDAHMR